VLRTFPCNDHPQLLKFDTLLRSAISKICYVSLSDDQWTRASLPVSAGGLGVRSVSKLASSAFPASAADTLPLQSLVLRRSKIDNEDITNSANHWKSPSGSDELILSPEIKQRLLDSTVANNTYNILFEAQNNIYHRVRLLAPADPRSGDWLHAMPITACGLRLPDEAVRVAVGMRLGTFIFQVHSCSCGAIVDPFGTHLTRLDGKRPDGLILIQWREGRSATWDVTVTNTVAASYLTASSTSAVSAAEVAAQRRETKYAEISKTHLFFPLAFETMGPINRAGHEFVYDLGHRISAITDDPRETSFLYQRISVTLQRFNAVCFSYAFEQEHNFSDNRPGYT
jgi:hypothetical protein